MSMTATTSRSLACVALQLSHKSHMPKRQFASIMKEILQSVRGYNDLFSERTRTLLAIHFQSRCQSSEKSLWFAKPAYS